MLNTVYIENLPAHEGAAGVERLFRPYGPVRCTAAATDPDMLRRHGGIALVELPSPVQARAAIRGLDGRKYKQGTLRVRQAVTSDVTRVRWACRSKNSIQARWDQSPSGRKRTAMPQP